MENPSGVHSFSLMDVGCDNGEKAANWACVKCVCTMSIVNEISVVGWLGRIN